MFATICSAIPADPDYPERTRRLDVLGRVLDGTLYDALSYEFHEERGAGGEYIPLRDRRPSVRYPLARIVVDDSVALVFSDGHFPAIGCADAGVRAALADIADESGLNQVIAEAALRGSVGSVAILLRVLSGRVFFRVLPSLYLTPVYEAQAPDTLARVTERYKVRGSVLAAQGYEIADPQALHWFQRVWDAEREVWFVPQAVGAAGALEIDEARSVTHGLGFVPIVWVRNLPGGDDVDGACTFRAAVETSIEIDYQLSQAGRGLKYSSDPTLLIREPAGVDGEIVRGANALVVSERGDAKLLEINGTAAAAVIDYVRTLREMALEGVHGNRASADRLTAPQSGRAMEMMNQGLVWLADNLRVSYGGALLALARMVLRAGAKYALTAFGEPVGPLDPTVRLTLAWPRWYAPTAQDTQADVQSLTALVGARLLSRAAAVRAVAERFAVDDIAAELERLGGEHDSETTTDEDA
ncbi:MAG TPA: phage portal protein [Acetobacteraceae bacterium]|jgi:hypothetical protein|nr:phage portal protein [Acetobacteraceae bacterium]